LTRLLVLQILQLGAEVADMRHPYFEE